jgi:hypothetical protein
VAGLYQINVTIPGFPVYLDTTSSYYVAIGVVVGPNIFSPTTPILPIAIQAINPGDSARR